MDMRIITAGNKAIFPEKLEAEIKRRGITNAQASVEIGRAPNYIATCIAQGNINKQSIILLEKLFGIEPESYLDLPTQAVPTEEVRSNGLYSLDNVAEEIKRTRGGVLHTHELIEELHYTVRLIEQHLAEIKTLWEEADDEEKK